MLIMGDPFQQIYRYRGASDMYLMDGAKYFGSFLTTPHFECLSMSICFRITQTTADFINNKLNPLELERACPDWWNTNEKTVVKWWGKESKEIPPEKAAFWT